MNMLCSRCKKRMAVVFITRMEGNETVNEGLCIQCARELGIKPVNDLVEKMGISDEELETMSNQLMDVAQSDGEDAFEMGGAQPFPFLQNMFGNLPHREPKEEGEQPRGERREKARREEKKLKYLEAYCENLTRKAAEGRVDRIIGRDEEIYRVMQILNRRTKNNPCLIGEPGVGKTAIAEGIAQRLAGGDVPFRLQGKQLWLLDLTALVAGTQFRGQFESRVKGLVNEIKQVGNVILFIDEIHNLVGAGDSEGSMNAANILKPALSRGEIQVIGATTFTEYRKHIEKDAALERRFQPVKVGEPNIADSIEILRGIKGYYEQHHRVSVPEEMLRQIVVLSERYIVDRYLPDKAIDLLDEACSCAVLANTELAEYDRLTEELKKQNELLAALEQAEELDYEKIAGARAESSRISGRLVELEQTAVGRPITLNEISRVIELWTGIPAARIEQNEIRRVVGLADTLRQKIIGQDEAVELVANAIRRSRAQISSRRRPASFIFVGPTGVGKTELVKVLAHELFDDQDPLIHLDMAEYMEKHAVSRLIGSPPGYIGYDEAGQLTEKVRRRPYSVVLFDEIEKAHPDVMNILLQILDEGKITDAQGRAVSFENTVIILTSNAGSDRRGSAMGFDRSVAEASREKAERGLREFLRPEFLGRIDEIVTFRPLDEADFARIAALMLEELRVPLEEKGIAFAYDEAALQAIAKEAFGHASGARDIRRVIRRRVEDAVSAIVIDTFAAQPRTIRVTEQDGAIAVLAE